MNRRSYPSIGVAAFAISAATILSLALPAYAQDASDISTPACERGNSKSLLIRDSLSLSGNADDPAILSLTHTAGDNTFGTADIAFMVDTLCTRADNSELRFAYGVDYHLNTNKDATSEIANAGFSMSYAWEPLGKEPAMNGGHGISHWRRIAANASYGRDIENDRRIQHVGIYYDSTPVGSRNLPEREGALMYSTGLLGGRIMARTITPDGGAGRSPPVFSYQFRPGVEYFGGYQPASATSHLDSTYATLIATAQWQPIFGGKPSPFYMRSQIAGRRKLWGDDAMPATANEVSAAIGMEMSQTPSKSFRQKSSVELSYVMGRAPENGFARDEMLRLTLTYLFDRRDSR